MGSDIGVEWDTYRLRVLLKMTRQNLKKRYRVPSERMELAVKYCIEHNISVRDEDEMFYILKLALHQNIQVAK